MSVSVHLPICFSRAQEHLVSQKRKQAFPSENNFRKTIKPAVFSSLWTVTPFWRTIL